MLQGIQMAKKSEIYYQTEGTVAELYDVAADEMRALGYSAQQDLVSALSGRALVAKEQLNLFAAMLHSEVSAGNAPRHLYDQFVAIFGGNAGQFLGV